MKEQDSPNDSKLPGDAKRIKKIGSYDVYFSELEHSIFIVTRDYHPGALKLSRDELFELLGMIELSDREIEEAIIKELEEDSDIAAKIELVISKEPRREIFKGAKIKLVLPGE